MTKELQTSQRPLHPGETYTCPVCRHGQVGAMPMMEDTFSCELCHHLFSANLERQVLKLVDARVPLSWHWNGYNWQNVYHQGVQLGWLYAIAGLVFVALPPAVIGFSAYLFPPLPGDPLSWFPIAWAILAFVVHLACFCWLIIEYYQFPVWIYFKAMFRKLIERTA